MVYMLLALAVKRCHRSRQPVGVSQAVTKGSFRGVPLQGRQQAFKMYNYLLVD